MITERIDAVTKIPHACLKTVLPAPRSLKVEIDGRCNYKCIFCGHATKPDAKPMDRALFSRVIRQARDAGVDELGVFFIGESFMSPWLPEAIAEAKAVGYGYVFLTTNGSLAIPERVEACMRAGLDSLKFSMNNADETQFTQVVQIAPRWFSRAIANIKAARRVRDEGNYSCRIYASSIRYDGEQGRRMQALVDEIAPYVDEHYWLPLFSWSGTRRDAEESAGMAPVVGNPGRLGAMREPLPCWAAFTEAHVTASGMLGACCFSSDSSFDMADLNSVDFMAGWNSPAFQALRAAHLCKNVRDTPCEACIARTA